MFKRIDHSGARQEHLTGTQDGKLSFLFFFLTYIFFSSLNQGVVYNSPAAFLSHALKTLSGAVNGFTIIPRVNTVYEQARVSPNKELCSVFSLFFKKRKAL